MLLGCSAGMLALLLGAAAGADEKGRDRSWRMATTLAKRLPVLIWGSLSALAGKSDSSPGLKIRMRAA